MINREAFRCAADVLSARFKDLSWPELARFLQAYEEQHGAGARKYFERTYLRAPLERMTITMRCRVETLLPSILSNEHKVQLLCDIAPSLLEELMTAARQSVRSNYDLFQSFQAAIRDVLAYRPTFTWFGFPRALVEEFSDLTRVAVAEYLQADYQLALADLSILSQLLQFHGPLDVRYTARAINASVRLPLNTSGYQPATALIPFAKPAVSADCRARYRADAWTALIEKFQFDPKTNYVDAIPLDLVHQEMNHIYNDDGKMTKDWEIYTTGQGGTAAIRYTMPGNWQSLRKAIRAAAHPRRLLLAGCEEAPIESLSDIFQKWIHCVMDRQISSIQPTSCSEEMNDLEDVVRAVVADEILRLYEHVILDLTGLGRLILAFSGISIVYSVNTLGLTTKVTEASRIPAHRKLKVGLKNPSVVARCQRAYNSNLRKHRLDQIVLGARAKAEAAIAFKDAGMSLAKLASEGRRREICCKINLTGAGGIATIDYQSVKGIRRLLNTLRGVDFL